MSFLRKLFGFKRRASEETKGKGRASATVNSAPAERTFDPTILRRFEKEIAAWPPGQARIALQIIKATLDGTPGVFDSLYPELTVSQLRATTNVLREIDGDPIEDAEPASKRLHDDISPSQMTHQQMVSLTKDYLEVRVDEGASGRPGDYVASLEYVSPSLRLPGKWPQMPLCGCCSVPFAIDARLCGLWVAEGYSGKQAGTIVPICAVCITYLNRLAGAPRQGVRFPLPDNYDAVGQEMCTRFPLDDLTKLAVVRVALVRKRLSDARAGGF